METTDYTTAMITAKVEAYVEAKLNNSVVPELAKLKKENNDLKQSLLNLENIFKNLQKMVTAALSAKEDEKGI
jgi:hypothetical protein